MDIKIELEKVTLERDVIGILNTIYHSPIITSLDENKTSQISVPRVNVIASVGNGDIVSEKFKVGQLVIIKNNHIDVNNYIIMDELTNETQTTVMLIVEYHLIVGILENLE